MKNQLFVLLILLWSASLSAQIQDEIRVLTGSLSNISFYSTSSKSTTSNNPTQYSGGSGFGLSQEVSYGVIKNNRLLSVGLDINFGFINPRNAINQTIINIGPLVSYQRFYSISDKLYFTPFARMSIGYRYSLAEADPFIEVSRNYGVIGQLALRPVAVTFAKSEKINFLLFVGGLYVNYSRITDRLDERKIVNTNFNLNGTLTGMGFGLQKLF